MRTIRRWEAKDIDTANKVHTFFMASITLSMLAMSGRTGQDEVREAMKESIANALNMAEDMGIEITDRDEVPAVFRSGFATDGAV